MACRQRHDLLAPAVDEWFGGDDEGAGVALDEGGEGGVNLAFAAGIEDKELHPLGARRFLHVVHHALSLQGIVWVYE